MFIEALNSKDEELMRYILTDKLHQPYEAGLFGFDEISESLKEMDVIGTVT
ncbi:MAG: hypothetical protein MZV70_01720 [Desulfobacterales bacterium]|nr:hypothetical protein [Desulfobacterales bacterium]